MYCSSLISFLLFCFVHIVLLCIFFFFHSTATTEIYTLSLHDALPISANRCTVSTGPKISSRRRLEPPARRDLRAGRSEEHTSELQSLRHLVCRLLLEKKKKKNKKKNKNKNEQQNRKDKTKQSRHSERI